MMTREQAIEFCIERNQLQLKAAEKIAKDNDYILENEVEKIKYNTRIDLANKYREIAELLKDDGR